MNETNTREWLQKMIEEEKNFNEPMDQDDYSRMLGRIQAYENCLKYIDNPTSDFCEEPNTLDLNDINFEKLSNLIATDIMGWKEDIIYDPDIDSDVPGWSETSGKYVSYWTKDSWKPHKEEQQAMMVLDKLRQRDYRILIAVDNKGYNVKCEETNVDWLPFEDTLSMAICKIAFVIISEEKLGLSL